MAGMRVGVLALVGGALGGCTAVAGVAGMRIVEQDSGAGSDAQQDATPLDAARDVDGGVVVVTDAAADAPLASVLRIRCGASQTTPIYTDSTGKAWSNDVDFDVGTTVANNDSIAGTSDPTLYHTERYADRVQHPEGCSYTFGSLPAGDYVIRLHFAEVSTGNIRGPGQRLFNVSIDGTQVLTNLDIFAEAGFDHALVKTFSVQLTTPPLVVRFSPGSVQNPKVDAIEVLSASGGGG